jgi:hypothetical protein
MFAPALWVSQLAEGGVCGKSQEREEERTSFLKKRSKKLL